MPDDPPLPVAKPALPAAARTELIGAEALWLEFLPLAPIASSSAPPAPSVAPVARNEEPPLPVPAPKPAVAAADEMALLILEVQTSTPARGALPAEALPFSDPVVLPVTVDGGAAKAVRFEVPRIGNMTIVPSLELLGLPPANAYDARISAPHDLRLTPSPGIDAVVQLGMLTLDARLNQPLRTPDTKSAPDTRYLGDRSNFGVDMKLKF